ncbi:MAG: hypothetical protein U5O15_09495 [Candidatus Krumholzibacteriota bacterium]|nr:hypothetical protein [Candidatus Krumholzibacteriota bacterium]
MSDTRTRIAGVVVTHGKLAKELIRTIESILGEMEDLYPVCSENYGDTMIVKKIRDIIEKYKEERVVLFADYSGGSCFLNCIRAKVGVKGIKLISGVNLPVLLDFVTKRSLMDYDEMTDHLVKRGRDSITSMS